MGRVSKRPHQARLPEIGRRPHQAGRVYMRTRPVMAMGGARGALVCRVWHVCGGRIGGAHERVGGACGCVCVRDVVSLCGQAYTPSH
jgi:hypothetical protein